MTGGLRRVPRLAATRARRRSLTSEPPVAPPDTATVISEPSTSTQARGGRVARSLAWGRRHWLFLGLLVLGVIARILVLIAFHYPFVQPDSHRYLHSAIHLIPDMDRTSGYSLLLHLFPGWRSLWPIPYPQHLFGLVMGGFIYWALLRRDVPRWGAALATVPVLLDPFQVALEHYVLSDASYELFMVIAFALLTFRRRINWQLALIAGLLIGFATLTRSVGDVLTAVAVLVLLMGQARWLPAVALVVGVAIPVAGYMSWFHHDYGSYSTGRFPENLLYAQVAQFADCSPNAISGLPAYEKVLCPKVPISQRGTPYYYTWGKGEPTKWYTPPASLHETTWQVMHDFSRRMIKAEPLAFTKFTVVNALRGFTFSRTGSSNKTGESEHWRFGIDGHYPRSANVQGLNVVKAKHDVVKPLAHALAGYSDIYIPGPFYAAGLIVAFLAALGIGRARRSGFRTSAFLFAATCVLLLLISTALSIFSWRYQLPQFVLIPPAAALGLTALLRRRQATDVRLTGRTVRELLAGIPLIGRRFSRAPS